MIKHASWHLEFGLQTRCFDFEIFVKLNTESAAGSMFC
jgi:hypothetical protein